MVHADMLEHAHRNDTVEAILHLAIIQKLKADPVAQAHGARFLVSEGMLLFRQGDASHIHVGHRSEIERQVSPAASDIENAQTRLHVELGGEEPELVLLRLLETLFVVEEIGAGILHTFVEKQAVEIVAEIVVVGDVFLCLTDGIKLLEALEPSRYASQHFLQGVGAERESVHRKQREKVPQGRVLKAEPSVHIGFARVQLRIEEELAIERGVAEHHGDLRTWRAGKHMRLPLGIDHF